MTKVTKSEAEIDKIVDDLVKDEKTAEALKGKLHQSIAEPEAHFARPEARKDDDDDMWDNMPV
ncbi:hypothetical protein [Celeribacter sp. PS-C1]|uniref:hypothetical protein n=1 Tax=Celeribacter sp. PS-C1 TaxID=2820813 RepID=UPI001CA498C1|nr:hypothetical protein [Celeribacter sp. PS-C1]MBW6417396.1 hypothetical protein [Celeribacter sp. PS-C1]